MEEATHTAAFLLDKEYRISHAQPTSGSREVDEMWLSAKRAQIAMLEQQGQQERAAFLRRVLGL